MTSFNIRPDDVGIRNLRNDNLKPRTTKPTTAVAPYPEIQPVKVGLREMIQPETTNLKGTTDDEIKQAPTREERGEHRRVERRQHQVPVILDTRSGSERRQLSNNKSEAASDATAGKPALGIDLYT